MPPFTAGAVGFFAYDAVRQIEKLPVTRLRMSWGIPDACLLFFDEVLAFDHVRKEIWLVATADVTLDKPENAYKNAVKRLDKLEKRLSQPLPKLADLQGGREGGFKVRQTEDAPKQNFLRRLWKRPRNILRPGTCFRRCFRSGSMWSRAWTASRCIGRCGR